jgi:predicted transcriptional regulator/putative methionine-R-sulfoxide reductase with GAF domain
MHTQTQLINEKLKFIQENKDNFETIEDIAMLTTTSLYLITQTDNIAVAIIEDKILKSVNVIGERGFLDLYLDQPSINRRAIRKRETQLVNNTQSDPDYFPRSGPNGLEMLSELCVPIIYEDRVLGTINLESKRLNSFSVNDALIVEAFSREIAPSMYKIIEGGSLITEPVESSVSTRSNLELCMDVLSVVEGGECVKTRIFNEVNVSWSPGVRVLRDLISRGFVNMEPLSDFRDAYRITELGSKTLIEYKKATI